MTTQKVLSTVLGSRQLNHLLRIKVLLESHPQSKCNLESIVERLHTKIVLSRLTSHINGLKSGD